MFATSFIDLKYFHFDGSHNFFDFQQPIYRVGVVMVNCNYHEIEGTMRVVQLLKYEFPGRDKSCGEINFAINSKSISTRRSPISTKHKIGFHIPLDNILI